MGNDEVYWEAIWAGGAHRARRQEPCGTRVLETTLFEINSNLAEAGFGESTSTCPWDLDGSGGVGASDLLSLLVSWGPCKGCPADFDGDGYVGASDLLALLANWGP